MCGRIGRCYRCACSKTHTELEAVNLSPGLPVGINYSSRAVARMPNVFLWELCLASDSTRLLSPASSAEADAGRVILCTELSL